MRVVETAFPGLVIIEPRINEDARGYFFESWQSERYQKAGIDALFIQDNESKSSRGVLRGLHYQLDPWAQAKLVRVVEGQVFDVAVDLRKGSPTFGRWFGLELDGLSKKQLYIPRGFAHGFSVLSETAVFSYKCDQAYHPEAERSLNLHDPHLQIDWKVSVDEPLVSEKDRNAPFFDEAEMNFLFDTK